MSVFADDRKVQPPTFDEIFAVISAAAAGDTKIRIPVSSEALDEDVNSGLALALNRLLDHTQMQIARLEAECRTIQAELAKREAALEATNKELSAFNYSVSHDLRAPLRAIEGYSQLLTERHADQLDEQGKGYLERLEAASQQMGHLFDDFLNFSNITRRTLSKTSVNLSQMAQDIADGLQESQPERAAEFAIQDDLIVKADRLLMQVVLSNLLGNAWKFTRDQQPARITFGMTQDGTESIYFVQDNGLGFDMAGVNRLFGAFQRLHGSKDFEGTGIGLATVQRVIHRHDGRIWAEGVVNEGATFYFTLA